MKKIFFFTTLPFLMFFVVILCILKSLASLLIGFLSIIEQIVSLYEHYMLSIKKGFSINDPRFKTLKDVFIENYNGIYKTTYPRYLDFHKQNKK